MLRVSLIVLLITLIPLVDARSKARADNIGILRDAWPNEYLTESIHEDGLALFGGNIFVTRMFHNKPFAYLLSIAKRYWSHFDPVYLFATSNPNMPKYSVPNIGLMYFFVFVTVFLGIYMLAKTKKSFAWIVVIWLFISPLPSSLSIETPNPIRALIGLPALLMLSSLGVWFICDLLRKEMGRFSTILVFAIIGIHFLYFWHQYTIHDVYHQPWYSDGGVEEMVESVNQLAEGYDKTVISGDPYIHFLFFNKVKPQDFLSDSVVEDEVVGNWDRVNSYGKIIFKMPYEYPKIGREKVLYVCRGEEIPQNSVLHKVIRFNDGKPAFLLLEFVPYSERQEITLPERVHWMVDTDLNFKEALLPENSGRYW